MQARATLALPGVRSRLWLQTEGLGRVGLGWLLRAGRRLLDGRVRLVAALVAPAEVAGELVVSQIAHFAESVFLTVHFGKRFNQSGHVFVPNYVCLIFGGLLFLTLFIFLSVFVRNVKDFRHAFGNSLILGFTGTSDGFGFEHFGRFLDRLLILFLLGLRLNALLKQIDRVEEILIVGQFLAPKRTKSLLQELAGDVLTTLQNLISHISVPIFHD